jgi:hypothetical protein
VTNALGTRSMKLEPGSSESVPSDRRVRQRSRLTTPPARSTARLLLRQRAQQGMLQQLHLWRITVCGLPRTRSRQPGQLATILEVL